MTITSNATLIDPIRARATATPDWLALVLLLEDGSRQTITASELWADVLAAASGLRGAGLRADDVVMVIMGHSRRLVAAFLGAMALGAVPTLVPAATARVDLQIYRKRIAALVADAGAAAIIVDPADAVPLREVLDGLACPVVDSDRLNGHADPSALPPVRSPDQIAFIQYSSGSGGMQKGVVHTHGAVLRHIEHKRQGTPLLPSDVVVNWTPLYHDLGLISGLLAPLVIGLRTVLMSPLQWVRQPGRLLQAMHDYGGTLCYMPNFALNHCVRATRERESRDLDLTRWRLLMVGGEPVRADSLEAFAQRFGSSGFRAAAFRAGYGMAEMVEGVTASRQEPPCVDWIDVTRLQRDARAEPAGANTAGSTSLVSCGPPKPGAQVRIVNAEGALLRERTVGEIEIRTDSMMREYHRRPDLTRAAFRDGWFRSGDLGYLAGGELYVVGRKKDLIIAGGCNIVPDEIETVAERVPGILPGRVVAFGVPDELNGTERVILVCESAQPDDLQHAIAIERQVRRATTQTLGITLGEVRTVERGWIIKTSSGKKARDDNRDKYLRQLRLAPEPGQS